MNAAEYERMYLMEERHWYFLGKRRIVSEILSPFLTGPPPKVLDAGCGTGGNLAMLGQMGAVVAVDPFPEAVSFCRSRGFRSIAQASVTALPFPDDTFDLVTSLDVIEHVDDDRLALREMGRVLRPGGLLMLTVPACMALWSGHDVALHHKRRYSHGEVREKLGQAGFSVIRCTSFNTILFPLAAIVRIARRSLPPGKESSDTTDLPAAPVNRLLCRIMDAEARLLRSMDFPIGVSLACLARKEPVKP